MEKKCRKILLCRSGTYSLGGVQRLENYVIRLLKGNDFYVEEISLVQPPSRWNKITFVKEYLDKMPQFSTVIFFHPGLVSVSSLASHKYSLAFTHGIELQKPHIISNLNHVNHVITNSEQNKHYLSQHGVQNVRQIYYPTQMTGSNEINIEKSDVTLCVSRLDVSDRYKGIDSLLDTWNILADFMPRNLVIVGSGNDLSRLKRYAKTLKNGSLITFLGNVDDEYLSKLYSNAHSFILLSSLEGQGLVYYEALSFGLPVIALKNTVAEEVVIDGVNGLLLEKKDPYSMAQKIISCFENIEGWKSRSHRAYQSFIDFQLNQRFDTTFLELIKCVG